MNKEKQIEFINEHKDCISDATLYENYLKEKSNQNVSLLYANIVDCLAAIEGGKIND